ncbi:hypothetical protein ACHAWF_009810 [Thalassiosira exigua]
MLSFHGIIIPLAAALSCLSAERNTSAFAFSSSHGQPEIQAVSTTGIYQGGNASNDVVRLEDDKETKAKINPCGQGFYPVEGEHGQVCVFDYEAAADSFGTAVEEHKEFVCDADDYWKDLDEKNKVRRKYGLQPLTPEQFVVLQAQILEMEETNKKKFDAAKVESKAIRDKEASAAAADNKSVSGMLKGFVDSVFEDTCESNYDCDRPEVCCDFGFKKTCCEGGKTAINLYGELATVPVPQSR